MKKEIQNIIILEITVNGRVNQPDIIGAIFGQTEDTLGEELALRKLQKEGSIGRIELEIHYEHSLTKGIIKVPSYMNLVDTVIVGASLETINKIGPCTASACIKKIENIKDLKVKEIKEQAKRVLQKFISGSVDSQELVNEVIDEVRMDRQTTWGEQKIKCGPKLDRYDEVILVETEEELLSLLKNNIKNVAMFGDLSKKNALHDLCTQKFVTVFINRGKEYLVKQLLEFADIDSVAKPEPPKRITVLTSKEIHKSIRGATAIEQIGAKQVSMPIENKPTHQIRHHSNQGTKNQHFSPSRVRTFKVYGEDQEKIKRACGETKDNEVCVLDRRMQLLGKVPISEVRNTLASLRDKVYALVVNANIGADLVDTADKNRIHYLVGKSFAKSSRRTRLVLFE